MLFRSSMKRGLRLIAVLIRHGLAHVACICLKQWPMIADRLPILNLSGPERLRALIEDLGGTFIKFGQMLALQPDILPLEFCNGLFDLLDSVSPAPFNQIEKIFIEEFGKSPAEIFDEIDREPIATASIGQVHVAYRDGRKLAVKVQRPNVESGFCGDIRLMVAAISIIKTLRVRSLYWMVQPTSEFVAWTAEELDYRREARYMEQHRQNARHNPHERIIY